MLPAGVSSINSNGGKSIYYRGVVLADLVSFIFQEKSFGVVGGLILPVTGNVSTSNTNTNTSSNVTNNNNNNNNNISNTNTNNNTTTSINLSSLSF